MLLVLCYDYFLRLVIFEGSSTRPPTDSEIKNLIAQKHEASTLAWFSNFNKLNGFEKSDNVYLADISYSIEFTMGIGEIDSV